MTFNTEQRRGAYRKLQSEVQDFVMDNETTELIKEYLKELSLEDEHSGLADSEILCAMFGLQTLSDAVENIAKLSGKNVNDLSKLKTNLENNIFKKIEELKKTAGPKPNEKPVGAVAESIKINRLTENKPQNNSPSSTVSFSAQYIKNVFANPAPQKSNSENQEITRRVQLSIRNKTKNDMPEYVKSLPAVVQDMLFLGVWMEKVAEIAKKYSLNGAQTNTLVNNIILVLIGLTQPTVFTNLMTSELGISKLLSEQLLKDIENRVFEYAVSQTDGKGRGNQLVSNSKPPTPNQERQVIPIQKTVPTISKIPELAPKILPMIEKNEPVKIVPVAKIQPTIPTTGQKSYIQTKYAPVYKPTPAPENKTVQVSGQGTKPAEISHINYTATAHTNPTEPTRGPVVKEEVVVKKAEAVQQPVSVPRFTATPIVENTPPRTVNMERQVATNLPRENFMDNKLNNNAVTAPEKKEPEKPTKAYVADPYREPLG